MDIREQIIHGTFLERPNRFLSMIEVEGRTVESHLPDPGRLEELLIPGAEVILYPRNSTERRTLFVTAMVRSGGIWVSINSTLPNLLFRECIEHQLLPPFRRYSVRKQEYTLGNSRFDFLLSNGEDMVVEVKSVTYVDRGIARFPDAVTERGKRHLLELLELQHQGKPVSVVFIIQRSDAECFAPFKDRDPEFSNVFGMAVKQSLPVYAFSFHVTPRRITYHRQIPVLPETA